MWATESCWDPCSGKFEERDYSCLEAHCFEFVSLLTSHNKVIKFSFVWQTTFHFDSVIVKRRSCEERPQNIKAKYCTLLSWNEVQIFLINACIVRVASTAFIFCMRQSVSWQKGLKTKVHSNHSDDILSHQVMQMTVKFTKLLLALRC